MPRLGALGGWLYGVGPSILNLDDFGIFDRGLFSVETLLAYLDARAPGLDIVCLLKLSAPNNIST